MKRRGLIIGIVAVAVILVTVFSFFLSTGRVSFIQNGVNAAMRPVETGIRSAVELLERAYDYMYNYDELEAENDRLLTQVAEFEETVRDAEEIRAENERLRELLDLKEDTNEMEQIDGYITNWDASNWTSAFTIDSGSDRGVEVGDPVITERGEMVGVVTQVGSSWSTVRTIIDVDTYVGALLGSGVSAVVEGNFSLMQEGYVRLSYVPSGEIPVQGDTVTTSGLGDVIPKGLVIGEIVSVDMEDTGASYYAIIEPAVDLGRLTQVFVLKSFELKD